MPAETGVQKILMNDFTNEHVTGTFSFPYLNIKSKGKQMVRSTQNTSHLMGYLVIILVKLTRIDLGYDFNYESNPTPFGCVLV
jgi:hypothetical protein